jgi:hypothetical protein
MKTQHETRNAIGQTETNLKLNGTFGQFTYALYANSDLENKAILTDETFYSRDN